MDLLFLLTIFPAYLVGSFFVKHDPGPTEPKKAIHKGVWFGVLAVVLALILSYGIDFFLDGDFGARVTGLESGASIPLFLDVLIFATIEELVKFVPIAVYLLRKDYFNEHTDGIIYFAIVGLTFGGIESFMYGLGSGDLGVVVAISRLILSLFFHGALTAIVGYYFARAKVRGGSIFPALLVLAGVSLAHALYNFFVFSSVDNVIFIAGAALIALAANIVMFWFYYTATANDLRLGLAGPSTKVAEQVIEQAQQPNTQPIAPAQPVYRDVVPQQVAPASPQPTAVSPQPQQPNTQNPYNQQ